jgi:hypothetical protein
VEENIIILINYLHENVLSPIGYKIESYQYPIFLLARMLQRYPAVRMENSYFRVSILAACI